MKMIDDFLNSITMYRLVLYYLLFLLGFAFILSELGLLFFGLTSLFLSAVFLISVSWVANKFFAWIFKVPANVESVYISALILIFIVTPAQNLGGFVFLFWAAVLAMASKYILKIGKKHLFNPAAISLVIIYFVTNLFNIPVYSGASWWVGNEMMFLPVVVGGLLIVRKIKRSALVSCFLITTLLITSIIAIYQSLDLFPVFQAVLISSPLFFFAFIMLTEPSTTPPTRKLQIRYGVLVGIIFSPFIHIGSFYATPELALVIGNLFSYIISPKQKFILELKHRTQLAPEIFNFIFSFDKIPSFTAGQYLEWTISPKNADSRGNRRYLTIASSPTEDSLMIGVKFSPNSSSFKRQLLSLEKGSRVIASQLSGEFILPKDLNKKLVFIAGGIGVTPFRSMIKYLLDKKEKRDIVLFYSNKNASEIVYSDIFSLAAKLLGIKVVYTLTDLTNIPQGWTGQRGKIDTTMLRAEVPDFNQRTFYLSGPHLMVSSFKKELLKMRVKRSQIKTDYFPGFS